MKRRFSAWLVVLAMALSLLPISALAAEESSFGSGIPTEEATVGDKSRTGGNSSEDTSGAEPSESNSEPTWQPDEDGVYVVSSDTDLKCMVQNINRATNGIHLKFRFEHQRTNNGTVYQFTSPSAIVVPEGASVTIDLGICDMLFNTEGSTIITNKGTLSIKGTTCTTSQYGRVGSEGHTIVNNGTMTLDTVYLAGTLDNQSQLTLSQTAESGSGVTNTCTVSRLSNSGTVIASDSMFMNIASTDGAITLTDCQGGYQGSIGLSGNAQATIQGAGSSYSVASLTLSDASSLTIQNGDFNDYLTDDKLTVGSNATLSITSGRFFFYPKPYLEDPENVVILRDDPMFDSVWTYQVSPIQSGASAPELTVTQGDSKDADGNVWVSVYTPTEDAQVYYSTDSAKDPVQCQTDVTDSRYAYLPVGTTVYAVALKEGCPAAAQTFTVTEPPEPSKWMPTITPDDDQAYQGGVTVTITPAEQSSAIYYTTNGQIPGYSTAARLGASAGTAAGDGSASLPIVGTRYSGPFTLTSSATVMAVEINPNGDQSEIASRQYRVVTNTNPGGGGGGSSSVNRNNDDDGDDGNTITETTQNPDGSTTTTVTDNRTGTVTETTRGEDGTQTVVETLRNGDTTTTVTLRDGTVATTTVVADEPIRADVDFSSQAVADSEDGRLTVPVQVDTQNSVVTVSGIRQPVKVAVPVDGLTVGTVAVIGGEIVKTAVPENGSLVIPMAQAGTVTIRDNTRSFSDVPAHHWAAEAITFATSRELFYGTGAETFSPDSAMTRQMLVTVLARLDGAEIDASPFELGMAWAQDNGISDGSNPTGDITREQLAVMMYRYAGSPAVDGSLARFADAEAVSDYAREAMTWAVVNGIVAGSGDGNLTPQGLATRAQVATMLQRYLSA